MFSCIVSFLTVSLINGTRGLLLSLHSVLSHSGRSVPLVFVRGDSSAVSPAVQPACTGGASLALASILLFLFCGVTGGELAVLGWERFHLIVIS